MDLATDSMPLLPSRSPSPPAIFVPNRAILTHTGRLNAVNWRRYLLREDNWDYFKRGLEEMKLLVICGVHGREDGSIGADLDNVETCKAQIVSRL